MANHSKLSQNNNATLEENLKKFQTLLKDIFQFESSDLDFGIYKILKLKQKEIETFIETTLRENVQKSFEKHKEKGFDDIIKEFDSVKKECIQILGNDCFDENDNIKKEKIKLDNDILPNSDITELDRQLQIIELLKKYNKIKKESETARQKLAAINNVQADVFNDLYNFFSRYYEDGDFVPKYRFSIKNYKYAIPYNGEEVKLYWANYNQYYIKSGLLFKDYAFTIEKFKIIFRIETAQDEINSNKSSKEKVFIFKDIKIETKNENGNDQNSNNINQDSIEIIIEFEYRELDNNKDKELLNQLNKDKKHSNKSNNESESDEETTNTDNVKTKIDQKQINENFNAKEILQKLSSINNLKDKSDVEKLKKLLEEIDSNTQNTRLLKHLNRFTSKNKKDYFIHKNLKEFLSEQLDFYIKSEVLNIETLKNDRFAEVHITRAAIVKEIGLQIIDFLNQIENFQKKLWEKKKFVTSTYYVITIDKLHQWLNEKEFNDIIDDVLKNEKQVEEWKQLGFGEIKTKDDIYLTQLSQDKKTKKKKKEQNSNLFEENDTTNQEQNAENNSTIKKLPIDTRHFDETFQENLLQKISEKINIEEELNGLLIKSENWQALNNLLDKYKEKIKCIYIDPPYNTGNDGFLYKDGYQHSTWLTMMENRLQLARELMPDDGVIFVSIDDNEIFNLYHLMSNIFYFSNYLNNFVWLNNLKGRQISKYGAAKTYESILCFIKNKEKEISFRIDVDKCKKYMPDAYKGMDYEIINDNIGNYVLKNELHNTNELFNEDTRPNLVFNIHYNPNTKDIKFSNINENISYEGYIKIEPKKRNNKYLAWRWSKNKIIKEKENLEFILKENDIKIFTKIRDFKYTIFKDIITNISNNKTQKELIHFFSHPKPIELLEILITIIIYNNGYILDFFAGSGTTAHAVMKLNAEDDGKRKFILVEMAEYFDTIIIPRIKKVAYSFDWKNGIPVNTNGPGVFFKYQYIEQYEDTLDNIELHTQQQNLFNSTNSTEYLIKYCLNKETQDSPFLLNVDKLDHPFDYKLKINPNELGYAQPQKVDIPETFNYLIGFYLHKIKVAKNNHNNKYLFLLGESQGKKTLIVWRNNPIREKDTNTEKILIQDRDFIKNQIETLGWKPEVIYVQNNVLTPNFSKINPEIYYIEPIFKQKMNNYEN